MDVLGSILRKEGGCLWGGMQPPWEIIRLHRHLLAL